MALGGRKEIPRSGRGGFPLASVLGFPITVDPSWFIIFFLITWTLAEGYFPAEYPKLPPGLYWGMGVTGALLLFFSILLHELSHAFVARQFGLKIHRITLFIFGGVSQMTEEPANAATEFWMAIAGPITSFILAFLFWILGGQMLHLEVWAPVPAVLLYVATVNLVLGLFNLVPGFPLDGGRVLRSALWYFMGDLQRATRIASGFGTGFAFLLMGWGALRLLGGNPLGGGWMILIGFFLWRASQTGYEQVLLRRLLEGASVGAIMRSDVVTLHPGMTVQEAVDQFFMRYSYHSFPVLSEGKLAGTVSMEEVRRIPPPEWPLRSLEEVMDRGAVRAAIGSSQSLLKAFQKMQQENRGRLPVVDEKGRLEGIISHRDIMHYFHLRLDLGEGSRRKT
jgi:Zn-dependent protease/CBS domain-containing protein